MCEAGILEVGAGDLRGPGTDLLCSHQECRRQGGDSQPFGLRPWLLLPAVW